MVHSRYFSNVYHLVIYGCKLHFSSLVISQRLLLYEPFHITLSSLQWRQVRIVASFDHRQRDCLFNSLVRRTMKTSKLRRSDPLWGKPKCYSRIPLIKGPYKGTITGKALSCLTSSCSAKRVLLHLLTAVQALNNMYQKLTGVRSQYRPALI